MRGEAHTMLLQILLPLTGGGTPIENAPHTESHAARRVRDMISRAGDRASSFLWGSVGSPERGRDWGGGPRPSTIGCRRGYM